MMGARSNGSAAARVLGRYELHGELAAGGMATVHLGRLRGGAGFSRTVVIKRLHPQFAKDPDFVAMFVEEARLAARIRHPNVVPTLDVISEDNEIFLVMEYVQGESLSRLFRTIKERGERMPPYIATTLLAGVLHGLHAAHEAKSEKGTPLEIVHRDVSPQNVLVGTDGIAHVLDFGVAKAQGQAQTTREGQLKGKIAYMAPEQLEQGRVTRQSDVYAAAVVLWEMLTSRRMFEADNEGAMLVKVMASRTAPPSTAAPGLSRAIDDVVMRGLAREPANRWASAREFALALEKCAKVAPPSEIGEWVQSIAGDELARRAKKVADVERGSLRAPAIIDDEAGIETLIQESSISGVRMGEVTSQVSSISVSKSEAAAPMAVATPNRWTRLVLFGLAGVLMVSILFAFTLGTRDSRPPSRAVATGPSLASPADPTPVETGSGAPAVMPEPVPPPTASAPAASATAEPESVDLVPTIAASALPRVDSPKPPDPVRHYSPPPPHQVRPRPDCDPPFTRDADGHKHYKMQCL